MLGISFNPDLRKYPVLGILTALPYVRLEKGKVEVIPDLDVKTKEMGVTEVSSMEDIESARILMKLFRDYTYVMTVLRGGGHIYMAGVNQFGFNAMQPGHLTLESVQRFAKAMKNLPRDEFNEKLLDQVGNPGLEEVIPQSV